MEIIKEERRAIGKDIAADDDDDDERTSEGGVRFILFEFSSRLQDPLSPPQRHV
jgi:hypothetical protein